MLYAGAVLCSQTYRRLHPIDGVPGPDQHQVKVPPVDPAGRADTPVRIAYREWGPPDAPAIVLLHGSPGDGGAFNELGPLLGEHHRVIAPDLPGFGGSTLRIPDYSIATHARYLNELLDSLG
ncbi:MAG TPA: alpha/beta fold hydrolase, partial [Streptosporangiaceae bacterium]|nr:alpha/beta fold hydrolase [Streptosporangiaceae bacterium]